jgi:tRNA (cmo5U34)-methyltransferase
MMCADATKEDAKMDTPPVDFDARPPMPLDEYERTVRAMNVGYDLAFTLTHCFLRALDRPDLRLLAVGAGGGAEIERFLPEDPGWRLTGVDPSRGMLDLARAKVDRLGLGERATLVAGTVADLPAEEGFDAATCLYVLHFLPDDGKLALLRGVAARLRPGAPLLAVTGCRVEEDLAWRDDFLGAWRRYGERMGMPAERVGGAIEQIVAQQSHMTAAAGYERLLREAGFQRVAPFLSVMGGGMVGWVAR